MYLVLSSFSSGDPLPTNAIYCMGIVYGNCIADSTFKVHLKNFLKNNTRRDVSLLRACLVGTATRLATRALATEQYFPWRAKRPPRPGGERGCGVANYSWGTKHPLNIS
jgi:hypothetical protein